MSGVQEEGGAPRSVDDLAADVRDDLSTLVNGHAFTRLEREAARDRVQAALSELVALVGTLTQERNKLAEQGRVAAKRYGEEAARRMAAEAALAREESQKRNLFFEREELWAALADMRRALEELLDDGGWGHSHWDSTGQHGAGCATCIAQREAKERARRALAGPAEHHRLCSSRNHDAPCDCYMRRDPRNAAPDLAAAGPAPEPLPSYPATPVDCLISELRDGYGPGHTHSLMTRSEFEQRIAQFKAEAAAGPAPEEGDLSTGCACDPEFCRCGAPEEGTA